MHNRFIKSCLFLSLIVAISLFGQTIQLSQQQLLSSAGISHSATYQVRHEFGINFFGSMQSENFKIGLMTSVEKIDEDLALPETYDLSQNYPNPFNQSTSLEIHLPISGEISVAIYSVLGQKVKTLFKGFQTAGRYRIQYDGKDDKGQPLSTGLYICRMQSDDWSHYIKMTIIR